MTVKPAGGRSVEEVLALLTDPEFCADATRTITEAAAMAAQASSFEEWEPRAERLRLRFFERWGVPPPTSGELADPDPRRRFVDAIASGRWGVVPVFPGVTNRQIQASTKKIRSVIRKQHQDALVNRHAQLVRWLEVIGFNRATIARAVFGRQTGLRRPTKEEAIERTPVDREHQLYEQYRGLGLTDKQIEQKIYKKLRGSEAPASAAVRMAEQRYVTRLKRLNKNLAMPVHSEPLSHALTTLFRSLPDENDATVKRHAIAVRDAFVHAAVPDEPPHHQSLEAVVVSALWGIVPVFPWTTDADFRASVGKLGLMMRPQSQDSPGPAQTPRPLPFEPLSDGLISLFQALSNDDAVVRRHAFEARAIFFRPGAL